MTPTDLIIFDLDGTLADTIPDIAAALTATLADIGVSPPPLAVVRDLVGDGSRVLIERALARAGATADAAALVPRFVDHYAAHVCVDSRLYPGVVPALEAARQAGVALTVITNKIGALARDLLDRLGVARRFTTVIGDGDGFPRKPDPTAARSIMAHLGTTPARTAVIGDGIPDVRTARAAGARAVAAGWGYVTSERLRAESPDYLAATPEEAVAFVLGRG